MEIVSYEKGSWTKSFGTRFDKKQTMSAHKRTPKYKGTPATMQLFGYVHGVVGCGNKICGPRIQCIAS
jgi:hypothetical protein